MHPVEVFCGDLYVKECELFERATQGILAGSPFSEISAKERRQGE